MTSTKNARPASPEPRIRIVKNGPYLVLGGVPLLEMTIVTDAARDAIGWSKDRTFPPRENYALCRCGKSKDIPFCDGSHVAARFDGTETASRKPYLDQADRIVGPELELTDAEVLCASAHFCVRAGGIWKLTKRSKRPEARQTAIEEAWNCPAGRLVVWDKSGNVMEPELECSIALVLGPGKGTRGPIWVRGGIPVESADGTLYEIRNRLTLCRCGKSRNKPFCDGSHNI